MVLLWLSVAFAGGLDQCVGPERDPLVARVKVEVLGPSGLQALPLGAKVSAGTQVRPSLELSHQRYIVLWATDKHDEAERLWPPSGASSTTERDLWSPTDWITLDRPGVWLEAVLSTSLQQAEDPWIRRVRVAFPSGGLGWTCLSLPVSPQGNSRLRIVETRP